MADKRSTGTLLTVLLVTQLFYSLKIFSQIQEPALKNSSVSINQLSFHAGDSIELNFSCTDQNYLKRTMTLNVVLKNRESNQQWKLRYPILQNMVESTIVLPENMPAGFYSILCAVQPSFFDLRGHLESGKTDSLKLNMLVTNKNIYSGIVDIRQGNTFRLGNLLFENEAFLFFTNASKRRKFLPEIKIRTPLDSAFLPIFDTSFQITIGDPAQPSAELSAPISAKDFFYPTSTLKDVEVIGKKKEQIKILEETYIQNPLFQNDMGYSFDGNDPAILTATDVLQFLQGRVPGLQISTDENGERIGRWRGNETSFFLDEMRVDVSTINTISTADIALIKAYSPPFFGAFGGGAGGAIAVYTKIGGGSSKSSNTGRFIVYGYTPLIFTLPVAGKE